MTKMTDDEMDSLILTAILGNRVLFPGREVRPHNTHDDVQGSNALCGNQEAAGPCCAVGAAVLYQNLGPTRPGNGNACSLMTQLYGVSHEYAEGVSYGFECPIHQNSYGSEDFARGYQVGKAAFEEIYGGGV